MGKKFTDTQSIVDVKKVQNGIVETVDGRYVKIIEVDPINFHLRSNKEKNTIIYNFAGWLKIAPVKVQFKSLSRPANINNYIQIITGEMNREPNPQCRELQNDYLQLICNVGMKEGVTRRFFIIIEYSGQAMQSTNYDDAYRTLNSAAKTIDTFMRHCGNKVISHEDEDVFICELFYTLYNRVSYEDVQSRMMSVVNQYAANKDKDPNNLEIADIFAPHYIHLDKEYMVVNDTYFTFLYIPSGKYKTEVYAGWLSSIINAGSGIDVDMFFEKQDKVKIRNRLGRQLRLNQVKFKDTQDTNTDYEDLSDAIQSGYYIKQKLSDNEDFYYMDTIITISGQSLEEIDYKTRAVREMLASQDFEGRVSKYHMLDTFRSIMPVCKVSKKIHSRAHRNVLTYGVASTYMFTSFEISDENGILFGINQQNNSLCIIDIFDNKKYKNSNVSILGTSGAGKTFLMQTMALRMRMKNIQTFIIAPLKGDEFKRACKKIGGEFISISPGSPNSINIMEIRPADDSNIRILNDEEDEIDTKSILSKKIANVHTFFSLVVPDMNYEEIQLVDNAIILAYERKGITHDNASLIDETKPQNGKLPIYKPMPILEDIYNELMKMDSDRAKRVALILDRYVHGSAKSFNQPTNVNLNNCYTVIDISEFSEEMQPIGMFVALDYIYDKIKEDKTKRKAVFIDEVWKLIGGSNSNALAAKFVLEVFKIIRGYGGAAIAATQDINDFFSLDDGKYGRGIIANSKTKIILQLESQEAERVQDIFELSDRELLNITRFERGQGLILSGANNVPVRFTASLTEEELITTDPNRLSQIVATKKAKKLHI